MKRIIRLSENDLSRIVRRVLNEQNNKEYEGEDVVYKYSVIGKYEKDGKKYDLVRYYFTIKDNTNTETKTDEPKKTKVDKILFKFEMIDAIPFKEVKRLGYIKINPSTDIPSEFKKNNIVKTFSYFVRGSDMKRLKIENTQFDTTFLVPEGYHFNVGYLDY
jgi:hypothetical protein